MADYTSSLTGQQIDAALTDMAMYNSEAWAVGKRNGIAVTSGDETWHNNSAYWAGRASAFNTSAQDAAARAEAAVPPTYDSVVIFNAEQNLTAAQKKRASTNIGANVTGDNLLDNGWFIMNQRNTADPTARFDFPADRWYIQNAGATYHLNTYSGISVTINEGVSYTRIAQRQVTQPFRRALGLPVTFSIWTTWGYLSATGTIPSSVPASGLTTIIPITYQNVEGASKTYILLQWDGDNDCIVATICFFADGLIRAAKVEIGEISTLQNDTSPNYAIESLRCQRHYFRVHATTNGSPLGTGYSASTSVIRILVPTPVWMRDPDQLYITNIGNFRLVGNGQALTPTEVVIHANARNGIVLSFTVTGATAYQSYALMEASTNIFLGFGRQYW